MMGWAHMALPTHSSVARPLGGPNFSAVSSHRISIARSTFYKMRATSVAFNDGLLWKPGGPQRTSSGPLWGSRGPTVKFTNANFTRHQISPPPPPMFYVPHIYTPPPPPTPAAQGGVFPSPARQLEFESALDFCTPTGASGASRSLGLQLIDSPADEATSSDDQSVVCAIRFMDDDAQMKAVSMGNTDSDMSLH